LSSHLSSKNVKVKYTELYFSMFCVGAHRDEHRLGALFGPRREQITRDCEEKLQMIFVICTASLLLILHSPSHSSIYILYGLMEESLQFLPFLS
jgi:hypothetical protein